jgi:hypothetical protein
MDYVGDISHSRLQQVPIRYREGDSQLLLDKNENVQWRKTEALICFIIWWENVIEYLESKRRIFSC